MCGLRYFLCYRVEFRGRVVLRVAFGDGEAEDAAQPLAHLFRYVECAASLDGFHKGVQIVPSDLDHWRVAEARQDVLVQIRAALVRSGGCPALIEFIGEPFVGHDAERIGVLLTRLLLFNALCLGVNCRWPVVCGSYALVSLRPSRIVRDMIRVQGICGRRLVSYSGISMTDYRWALCADTVRFHLLPGMAWPWACMPLAL